MGPDASVLDAAVIADRGEVLAEIVPGVVGEHGVDAHIERGEPCDGAVKERGACRSGLVVVNLDVRYSAVGIDRGVDKVIANPMLAWMRFGAAATNAPATAG